MFPPDPRVDVSQLHPRALAYLGDAVYELWVRTRAVETVQSNQSEAFHEYGIRHANAEAQGDLLSHWETHLSETEAEIVRRGRNVSVSRGRRSDHNAHRVASGFEALIGYLYLTDRDRLAALLALATIAAENG